WRISLSASRRARSPMRRWRRGSQRHGRGRSGTWLTCTAGCGRLKTKRATTTKDTKYHEGLGGWHSLVSFVPFVVCFLFGGTVRVLIVLFRQREDDDAVDFVFALRSKLQDDSIGGLGYVDWLDPEQQL